MVVRRVKGKWEYERDARGSLFSHQFYCFCSETPMEMVVKFSFFEIFACFCSSLPSPALMETVRYNSVTGSHPNTVSYCIVLTDVPTLTYTRATMLCRSHPSSVFNKNI